MQLQKGSMMKNRKREILENVEIEAIASEGMSLARVDGIVLFVPMAVPGDIVDVEIWKKKSNYMEGRIVRIVKPSDQRVEPFCEHFGVCGGCKWQQLPYHMQLEFKQRQVSDQLKRIGRLDIPEVMPIIGSEKTRYYRNKLDFAFSNRRWIENIKEADILTDRERLGLGFHVGKFFDKILDIKCCHLQPEPSNAIRLFIKDYAIRNNIPFFDFRAMTGMMRDIIIRTASTGEVMVIMVFAEYDKQVAEDVLDALMKEFPQITSLYYMINQKCNDSISDLEAHFYAGEPAIHEKMEDLTFKIGPKSFYQTNSSQAYRLYSVVRDFASLTGNEVLYDLYTGTGTIALFLSGRVSKVIGIEYVPEAIEDAKENASANGVGNAEFYAGDMKDILTEDFISQHGRPDVIVLDPPRAGIHPDVGKVIVAARPERIVYVSCNPASQARDLAAFDEMYRITAVQPVDMFPHTQHVENVVSLVLRDVPKTAADAVQDVPSGSLQC